MLIALVGIVLLSSAGRQVPVHELHHASFRNLKGIPEPSDIVYIPGSRDCYIVSDHGILFRCDSSGTPLQQAQWEGMDYEGVEIVGDNIYVSDETPRKVYKYSRDMQLLREYQVSWQGALNKAFESIAWNSSKQCFVLVSQEPVSVVEYDTAFHVLNKYQFHGARNIASARWHNGYMYLLSSKDRCILQCDPQTYEVKQKYIIDVLNPEGLAFDASGNVVITSDALQRLYFFNQLQDQ